MNEAETLPGNYSFLRPKRPPPQGKPFLRVGIVPTPDFTLLSLAGFVEFLRLAADENDFSRQIHCAWDILSADLAPLPASCGFSITPTAAFANPRDYDYIVVHGGILHGEKPVPESLIAYIRAAVEANVPLVGLCTGQFLLAEMGLLSGLRCAVHFSSNEAMQRRFPEVITVTDRPVVTDGGFITCPGGLASLNLAMHLVTRHCGEARTRKALHYLMTSRGFEELKELQEDPGLGLKCLDQRVVNAVGLMRQRTFERSSVAEIARSVGTSTRELTRLFHKHLSATPADYWRNMRIKSARWMVLNTNRSITQIAHECGFNDSSHMIYWFNRSYGMTPSKLRRTYLDLGTD